MVWMKWMMIYWFLSVCPAWAQPSQKELDALNVVQEELTACAAYFQFGKRCAPDNATREQLQQADKVFDHFMTLAYTTGKTLGMTDDAMLARLKMALQDQTQLTEGKCVNFASLLSRFADHCKRLGEDPKSVLQEYMAK
jgi:hypothetical protein